MSKKDYANENITNEQIAGVLERIADLLEAQEDNEYRVQAYRNAAVSVRESKDSIVDMVREGDGQKLRELPGVGVGLAKLISTYVQTGESKLLNHLRGEIVPEEIFAQVPAIGHELARRITKELDITTLEELEQSAYDGRLLKVEGFGEKRVETVRMSLAGMLSRSVRRRARQRVKGEDAQVRDQPSVETLLSVDAEYREKARAGELRKIAPKRFNPTGEAWLPILNTKRGEWSFTVLYSNTARAHELGTTNDWVVIYYTRGGQEDQVTVITKNTGPMEGQRVVRGREAETLSYYQEKLENVSK